MYLFYIYRIKLDISLTYIHICIKLFVHFMLCFIFKGAIFLYLNINCIIMGTCFSVPLVFNHEISFLCSSCCETWVHGRLPYSVVSSKHHNYFFQFQVFVCVLTILDCNLYSTICNSSRWVCDSQFYLEFLRMSQWLTVFYFNLVIWNSSRWFTILDF